MQGARRHESYRGIENNDYHGQDELPVRNGLSLDLENDPMQHSGGPHRYNL